MAESQPLAQPSSQPSTSGATEGDTSNRFTWEESNEIITSTVFRDYKFFTPDEVENLIHSMKIFQLKNLAVHPKAGNCQRRRFQSYLQILYYSIYQTMLLVKLLQSLCPP